MLKSAFSLSPLYDCTYEHLRARSQLLSYDFSLSLSCYTQLPTTVNLLNGHDVTIRRAVLHCSGHVLGLTGQVQAKVCAACALHVQGCHIGIVHNYCKFGFRSQACLYGSVYVFINRSTQKFMRNV